MVEKWLHHVYYYNQTDPYCDWSQHMRDRKCRHAALFVRANDDVFGPLIFLIAI